MDLADWAGQLAERLAERKMRVVFAESCTAGLVSAALAGVPGVSQFHCGSAVTYRNDTKSRWLHIAPQDLLQNTAVSDVVARLMARGVLENTPEASVSLSVTGHLGPYAPEGFDGVVFIGGARRSGLDVEDLFVERLLLSAQNRSERQLEAAMRALQLAVERLLGSTP